MRTSENINEIAKAINSFRQAVKQPTKDGDNKFLKSRYVQLEGVVDAIDRALTDTGLAYTQEVVSEGNQVSVTTLILHSSGQFIELGPLSVPVAKTMLRLSVPLRLTHVDTHYRQHSASHQTLMMTVLRQE